ncbi:MAG: hypothetical protein KME21_28990 [Desmonostoc vinosum HA7617-LM4]|nr:hypothetical protein [Desmonostoc vinosum HA7617-LM4]
MPLLLHQKGASDEQVKQASVWAIAQLSSQIEIIRQICLAQTSCSQPRQLTLPFDNGWSNSHSIEELEKQLTEI